MEWVATKRMHEEYTLKLGISPKLFKLIYNENSPYEPSPPKKKSSGSKGRKRISVSARYHPGVEEKKRKKPQNTGSSQSHTDTGTLIPNFQGIQDWNQRDTTSGMYGPTDQSWNTFAFPFTTSNYPGSVPFSQEEGPSRTHTNINPGSKHLPKEALTQIASSSRIQAPASVDPYNAFFSEEYAAKANEELLNYLQNEEVTHNSDIHKTAYSNTDSFTQETSRINPPTSETPYPDEEIPWDEVLTRLEIET
ncbi:hypothetical protein HMI55_001498 [Coelomomyces lativittatus]|nr:hypothetical protein HMI55_001498 [Coelomomyces lativittatus]